MKMMTGRSTTLLVSAAALAMPFSAAAQSFGDAMSAAVAQRAVDPSLPGDDELSCDQIGAEVKARNQEVANLMSGTVKMADNQMKAQETERKAAAAAATARDVANAIALPGMAPGNIIHGIAEEAISAKRTARQAKTVAEAGAISGDIQFAAQRIPHLHKLYADKCVAAGGSK